MSIAVAADRLARSRFAAQRASESSRDAGVTLDRDIRAGAVAIVSAKEGWADVIIAGATRISPNPSWVKRPILACESLSLAPGGRGVASRKTSTDPACRTVRARSGRRR
jgi:hypothetical protein